MPMTRQRVPSSSIAAAACADVTTWPASTATPAARSTSATAPGVREALFVTTANGTPASRSPAIASAAPGTGSSMCSRTPSTSSTTAS
jgi:hypothetical protein